MYGIRSLCKVVPECRSLDNTEVFGFVWLDKVSGMVQFFAFGTELIAFHNAMVLQKIQQEASEIPLGRVQGHHEVSSKGTSVHWKCIAYNGSLPRLSCHGGIRDLQWQSGLLRRSRAIHCLSSGKVRTGDEEELATCSPLAHASYLGSLLRSCVRPLLNLDSDLLTVPSDSR